MVNETITRIEHQIESNSGLDGAEKQELLTLVANLKREVSGLAETHVDDARSLAEHAATSVHEATRETTDPELLKHSLEGLSLAVRKFEVSHPGLTGIINNIGQTLYKMGI